MFLSRPETPHYAATACGTGKVSLVGAGPGDPELLTLKAARLIADAGVILHDRLVGAAILDLAPAHVARIDVGKSCGRHSMDQQAINHLLVAYARAGYHVVRLKGGDPFVFGRGGEELRAVRAAGLPIEIIPGITTACAAAASLQIPLTDREAGRSLHFVAGRNAGDDQDFHDWARIAGKGQSLVIYMGARRCGALVAAMLAAGISPDLPALAVARVGSPQQRHSGGRLADLADCVGRFDRGAPILLMIGDNFALREFMVIPISKATEEALLF